MGHPTAAREPAAVPHRWRDDRLGDGRRRRLGAIPEKFEAGTQDAAGIYATGAAIDYICEHGRDELEARERELAACLCEQLQALPFIQIVGPADPRAHVGAVSFNVEGIHPHDVSSLLDTKDVAIRAGHHCAQPLLTWMGIESCCRASVAF